MASSSFRDSMNSLGWSRREQPANTNKQNPLLGSLQRYNPFGGEGNVQLPTTEGEAPGAPLPARSRREEEEGWFALSRWDRILIFGGLNLAAVACFVICFTLLPILSLRPRKFAILGSGRLTIAVWGHAAARCNSSWLVRAFTTLQYYVHHAPGTLTYPGDCHYLNSAGGWSMASALFLSSWAVMMGPMAYVRHLISQERLPFTATYFGSIVLTLYFAVGLRSTILTLFSSIVQVVALLWYLVSYFPLGSQGLRFAARFGGSRVTAWMNE
ncbi:hypothetical protein KC327_g10097 [Hortaea werneckii]|nr:hypothetical protein KC341_g7461 [Hortaea werneckii]KAI7035155.1 hypothetical protein KC362_g7920 [Hortaea werneckii]KAI7067699.1 hypothetical protein KC327_g10097 [Hortaea werneckii]